MLRAIPVTRRPRLPAYEPRLRTRTMRAVALLMLAVNLAYLVWRALYTLEPSSMWISLLYLGLEAHLFGSMALLVYSLWDVSSPAPARPADGASRRVALLIPTYNESREVLLPVIASAVELRPAHETWVLDDGARPWLRELAAELGARYLAREDRAHAKAGNINNALRHVDAELIAFLDADHIPMPDFLRNTLGYFDDPRVALVQTPQDYYNTDSFEHLGGKDSEQGMHWYEQAMFFRAVQAGKDRRGAAFWCGTGSVIRASALREVGGIATETITEDIHTSMRLHSRGWRSVYHNEPLARGLAARTAAEYRVQRFRWAAGAMQLLRTESPLLMPGLTASQRIEYVSSIFFWFESWRTLGMLLVPVLVLLTGAFPIRNHLSWFIVFWGFNALLQEMAGKLLSRGYRRSLHWVIFQLVSLSSILQATLTLISRRPLTFGVTPKGRLGDDRRRTRPSRLLLGLAALSVVSLAWAGLSFAGFTPVHYDHPAAVAVNVFWVLANLALVLAAVQRVRSMRYATERRTGFRFALSMSGSIAGRPCRVQDVSMTGARVLVEQGEHAAVLPVNQDVTLEVLTVHGPVALQASVRSARGTDGSLHYGVLFCEGQTAALRLLALSLAASWAAGETQLVQRADESRPPVGIRGFELAQ